ncbi:TasA family protein [Ferdinandcohnia sp. Marseille-Q9671]
MLNKKKLATIATAGILSVGLLAGGATYALFTGQTSNDQNEVVAGSLELSTHRHDIPIEGPMFYINDNGKGMAGTGVWAPLDSHTRAMFITNNGSLDGKLTKLFAVPEGTDAEKDSAQAFAEQSLVTAAVFQLPGKTALDATLLKELNEWFDDEYKEYRKSNPATAKDIADLVAELRTWALELVYNEDTVANDLIEALLGAKVVDVYVGSLEDMMATDGVNTTRQVKLLSGETMHLAYTVELLNDKYNNGTSRGFDNDDIQGLTGKFTFKTLFEQVRNN